MGMVQPPLSLGELSGIGKANLMPIWRPVLARAAMSEEGAMDKPWPQPRIEELLISILEELKSAKMPIRLWSVADIAAYLNRSKITIQQRVVCKPDFPKAVRIPTATGKVGPLWYADEVRRYVRKHQKK
jgi:hypothetical protein